MGSSRTRLWPAALVAGWVTGCGYAQWPLPLSAPVDVNAPPPAVTGDSNVAFIGAGAVIVGRGDTVYGLARRHRVSVRAIIEANALVPPYHLNVGQRVVLLRRPKHVVKRGDTLYAVARQYGVVAYDVARLNNLKPPYTIHVGQSLVLPDAGRLRTVPVSRNAEGVTSPSSNGVLTTTPTRSGQPPASETTAAPPASPTLVPRPPAATGKGFQWPVRGRVVSGFGAKAKGLRNDGINIAAKRGSLVRAAENGVVAYAGNELRGFGNLLLLKHSGGWVTAYAHNDKLLVKRGQKIKKGQNIATVGSTGNVRTPQLHFELRKGRRARDPKKYLRPA
ncbi:MAG: peptidoglycan DD-metalloendopeptidase family protein [Pseudomonadota bacterium]|nr:peptidoglycan DD-metalloendopeptidase family protein [Pseudomonadota bacterium]